MNKKRTAQVPSFRRILNNPSELESESLFNRVNEVEFFPGE